MNDAAHIKPLTALRFFAAMWVVLYHYWPNLQGAAAMPALVGKGYLGVELFFTLSGFILCHVYLESFGEGRFRYGAFLWNRLARVYPLHLATLLGVMALGLAATAAGFAIDACCCRPGGWPPRRPSTIPAGRSRPSGSPT
jgi:peptidoglycan/LPS O-acetylase OafA/YrhL